MTDDRMPRNIGRNWAWAMSYRNGGDISITQTPHIVADEMDACIRAIVHKAADLQRLDTEVATLAVMIKETGEQIQAYAYRLEVDMSDITDRKQRPN